MASTRAFTRLGATPKSMTFPLDWISQCQLLLSFKKTL